MLKKPSVRLVVAFYLFASVCGLRAADFQYIVESDEVTITGYTGEGGDVVIPETIDGLSVVGIGASAFAFLQNLTSTEVPIGVRWVGDSAFQQCTNLVRVVVPDSVISIGEGAFANCLNLSDVDLGDGLEDIGDYAFIRNSMTHLTLPESVSEIGEMAFYQCQNLTNFVVPEGVEFIERSTFSSCSNLVSVTIGSGVTNIGEYAFSDCLVLQDVEILGGVTIIGEGAFYACEGLERFDVPDGVGHILDKTFYGCSSLGEITVSDSVTLIGDQAFSQCSSLTNVVFGVGLNSIGENAFERCVSLTNISFPVNLSSIGRKAFVECYNLETVAFPEGLSTIETYAFLYCDSLATVFIPGSVITIGKDAFDSCGSLESIHVAPHNPNYTSSEGVLLNKDGSELLEYPGGRAGEYTVPMSVTSFDSSAFFACGNLTRINVHENVTELGLPFSQCGSLTNITVAAGNPEYLTVDGVLFTKDLRWIVRYPQARGGDYVIPVNIESIGAYAFSSSVGLREVRVPESVLSISEGAFSGCEHLSSLMFEGDAPRVSSPRTTFIGVEDATVYYLPGTSGWEAVLDSLPTAIWQPRILTDDVNFGESSSGFGFMIDWAKGFEVEVQSKNDLNDPDWTMLDTITLSDGVGIFSDPDWENHPARVYQVKMKE